MIIFLTQNSHYFVHRYFSKLFKKHDSIVVFVNEQKRGKKRKYREILHQFGLHNIAYIVFMEAILFLFFRSRSNSSALLILTTVILLIFKACSLLTRPNISFNRLSLFYSQHWGMKTKN